MSGWTAFEQVEAMGRIDSAHDTLANCGSLPIFPWNQRSIRPNKSLCPPRLLGGRVPYVVDSEVERSNVVGTGQRRVDQRLHFVGFAQGRELFEVDDRQMRIGR